MAEHVLARHTDREIANGHERDAAAIGEAERGRRVHVEGEIGERVVLWEARAPGVAEQQELGHRRRQITVRTQRGRRTQREPADRERERRDVDLAAEILAAVVGDLLHPRFAHRLRHDDAGVVIEVLQRDRAGADTHLRGEREREARVAGEPEVRGIPGDRVEVACDGGVVAAHRGGGSGGVALRMRERRREDECERRDA